MVMIVVIIIIIIIIISIMFVEMLVWFWIGTNGVSNAFPAQKELFLTLSHAVEKAKYDNNDIFCRM